jgi:hypothetical protein
MSEMIWLFALIAIGALAYRLRVRHRLLYGFGEITVSILLMIVAVYHIRPNDLLVSGSPLWQDLLRDFLLYTVAIYLMVRGLDNIEMGLPSSHWLRGTWLFRK